MVTGDEEEEQEDGGVRPSLPCARKPHRRCVFLIQQSCVAKRDSLLQNECKAPEVVMVTDRSPHPQPHPQWTKQPNTLLFIVKEWIHFLQYWVQKTQEREELREYGPAPCPPPPPPSRTLQISFLGLLGDHVARGRDRTAAVGLLLLSWLEDLEQEQKRAAVLEQQQQQQKQRRSGVNL